MKTPDIFQPDNDLMKLARILDCNVVLVQGPISMLFIENFALPLNHQQDSWHVIFAGEKSLNADENSKKFSVYEYDINKGTEDISIYIQPDQKMTRIHFDINKDVYDKSVMHFNLVRKALHNTLNI